MDKMNIISLADIPSPSELEELYNWVDQVPLNRKKKNIQRDFSDGSIIATIIHFYLPKSQKGIIQVHNYVEMMNRDAKIANWNRLNVKIFPKLNKMNLKEAEIEAVVDCHPRAIEIILKRLKASMDAFCLN